MCSQYRRSSRVESGLGHVQPCGRDGLGVGARPRPPHRGTRRRPPRRTARHLPESAGPPSARVAPAPPPTAGRRGRSRRLSPSPTIGPGLPETRRRRPPRGAGGRWGLGVEGGLRGGGRGGDPPRDPGPRGQPLPVVARRQTSRRNSLCLVRCLCSAFSRMPRGCSARATASSSSGSCTHHQPLCISARQHRGGSAPRRGHRRHPLPGVGGWGVSRGRALTRGNRLLRQLGQVLLFNLLEEFGRGSPSALGLPR